MSDASKLPVKLYYRIGEVAEIVGVEPHVLRYWETEFRTIRPQKSRKGQRIYSRRDVEKLMRVKDLLYNHGFTIAGARKRLREGGAEPVAESGGSPEKGYRAAKKPRRCGVPCWTCARTSWPCSASSSAEPVWRVFPWR